MLVRQTACRRLRRCACSTPVWFVVAQAGSLTVLAQDAKHRRLLQPVQAPACPRRLPCQHVRLSLRFRGYGEMPDLPLSLHPQVQAVHQLLAGHGLQGLQQPAPLGHCPMPNQKQVCAAYLPPAAGAAKVRHALQGCLRGACCLLAQMATLQVRQPHPRARLLPHFAA